MSKRSNRKGYRKESRGWWDHGGEAFGEWTCEGGANRETSVVADGDRTRYQGGTYGCTWQEWAQCANLGGTAGSKSCPNGDKAFFVYLKSKRRNLP